MIVIDISHDKLWVSTASEYNIVFNPLVSFTRVYDLVRRDRYYFHRRDQPSSSSEYISPTGFYKFKVHRLREDSVSPYYTISVSIP